MVASAERYFNRVRDCWQQAESIAGSVRRCYRMAGHGVAMNLAGTSLQPLMMRPFAHLRDSSDGADNPDLVISIWDAGDTGVAIPGAPGTIEDFTPRGELGNFDDGRYCAAFQPFGRILNVFDRQRREAFVGVAQAHNVRSYERAIPLHAVFGWFMSLHGKQVVHAASVGTSRGAVLIVGRGGAGKSNTAVGSFSAGLDYFADDLCVIAAEPEPMVYSLYCTSRVRSRDWAALPFQPANPGEAETEKSLHYLHEHSPQRTPSGRLLRAMLLPARTGSGPPRLRPAPATLAAAHMASQSAAMLPGAGPDVLARVMRVARRIPAFHLELGTEPHAIPGVIRDVIDRCAAGST